MHRLIFIAGWLLLAFSGSVLAQNVGIGTPTPNASAALDVSSNNRGFLPPRMTTAERNAIATPAPGLMIFNTTTGCMNFYTGTTWGEICAYPRNCLEVLTNNPSAPSGVYTIDPDGVGGISAMSCQCDMTTDGGGWTLILNYNHLGGTNPNLLVLTSRLPIIGSTTLGVDESASATTWGHAGPSLLNLFTFTQLRFFARTSAHARVIHFRSPLAAALNYARTGTGSMVGLNVGFTLLAGHTANLPGSIDSYFNNQGTIALTEFPFYRGGAQHWGIRGLGNRWEVDDFAGGPGSNTYHQIWIR